MRLINPSGGHWVWASALLLPLCGGCGGSDYSRYTPTAADARKGLETALAAWQGGQGPDALAKADPPIQVIDTGWRGGEKLGGYEILSEEAVGGHKRFTVRLSLKQPKADREVRYVVLGKTGDH